MMRRRLPLQYADDHATLALLLRLARLMADATMPLLKMLSYYLLIHCLLDYFVDL